MKHAQLDTWSTREQLALASAVLSSGDQNWVAVSRAIRTISTEGPRPQDWYSTKNCALQYAKLLEGVSPAKRNRDKDKGSGSSSAQTHNSETPGETLANMLNRQHLEELVTVISEERRLYNQLRRELSQLEAGHLDHQLELLWEQMVQEEREDQQLQQRYEAWAKEREDTIAAIQHALKPLKGLRRGAVGAGSVSSTHAPLLSSAQHTDDGGVVGSKSDCVGGGSGTPTSPLLSSLLTRTPLKLASSIHEQNSTDAINVTVPPSSKSPLVLSTSKGGSYNADQHSNAGTSTRSPLLEQTPSKPSVKGDTSCKDTPEEDFDDYKKTNSVSPQSLVTNSPLTMVSVKMNNTSIDDYSSSPSRRDDKSGIVASVNGLTGVLLKAEKKEDTCGKQERMDTDAMVIKEDTMIIINQPEKECQSYGPLDGGCGGKDGYQETVCSSPKQPKDENGLSVWDDMKGCGEVLRLGEVQRKYGRPKYHHDPFSSPSPRRPSAGSIKVEKESDVEEGLEQDDVVEEEEDEDDGGFAGFGPSSMSIGSKKIGSVMSGGGGGVVASGGIGGGCNASKEEGLTTYKLGVVGGAAKVADELEDDEDDAEEEEEDVYNIDNDDTIGIKATRKLKLREQQFSKISHDNSTISSTTTPTHISDALLQPLAGRQFKVDPVVSLGSPVPYTSGSVHCGGDDLKEDRSRDGSVAATKDSSNVTRKTSEKMEDRPTIDFDDCDSVDSLITNPCESDAVSGARGCKRKLQQLVDSTLLLGSPHAASDTSPESPASTTACSEEPDSDKSLRPWRRSIMIVWNEIAAHKFANVFLRPITEEKVPGYLSVIRRPMDLQTIKRNMESGVVRTTAEFQRDIMLMCCNAAVYNTRGHDVYDMACTMMKDALDKIEEFQSAAEVLAPESPHKALRRETRESLAKRVDDTGVLRQPKKKKTGV